MKKKRERENNKNNNKIYTISNLQRSKALFRKFKCDKMKRQ